MAIKENLQAIKEEIGAEEQFLESLIKGERFFKKYKTAIIASVATLVLFAVGYSINDYLVKKELLLTNEAYQALLKNPKDTKSLEVLKKGNAKLYNTFLFSEAMKNGDEKKLTQLLNSELDPILKDMAKFDLKQDSELYKNMQNLLKGYDFLKQNKQKEAKNEFSQIPLTSELQQIVKKLNHYQGK